MAVMGIDLGTSSVKALILDAQGHMLASGKASYQVIARQPGWAESDPEEWWQAIRSAVQTAIQLIPEVEITALGLSGQMHGVVLASDKGLPLRQALLWADNRAEKELELYLDLPINIRQCLGNPLIPGMAGPLLCWLARHEQDIYKAARWALQPKDWIRFFLTGQAASDPSDASATLLYDLVAGQWAGDIIDRLGLRRELFAPILPSPGVAGQLTAQAATALGLKAGLPVAVGAADTAAAALGTGLHQAGIVQLTLGTGAQLIQMMSSPEVDPEGRTHLYRAADGEHWYRMAAVQNAGLALDWVRRMFGASWDELYASAALAHSDCQGLFFLPYLTRERTYLRSAPRTGSFLGLRIDHQREDLFRAVLEGVASNIRAALDVLPLSGISEPVRLVGGGSIHSAWRQMLADILGKELAVVDIPDASARGAALLAGIASGVWENNEAVTVQASQLPHLIHPNRNNQIYEKYMQVVSSSC